MEPVKYQNWPLYVKVVTALSNPRFTVKTPTVNFAVGYLLFVPGIIGLVYTFFRNNDYSTMSQLSNAGYTFIGLGNIIAGYAIKWIVDNSSWEERFNNKSSTGIKLFNILVLVIMLACCYVILKN